MKKTRLYNVKISLKHSPKWSTILCIGSALDGIVPNIQTLILATIINDTSLILKVQSPFRIYVSIILLMITIAYTWISNQLMSFAEIKLINKFREELHKELMFKSNSLQYEHIENKESQNMISRVIKEPEQEIYKGFSATLRICTILVRVIGLGFIIMYNAWWCGILMILTIVPLLLLAKKNGQVTYLADKDASLSIRNYEYMNDLLTDKESVMERNIFGYLDFIQEIWMRQYDNASKKQLTAFLTYFLKTKCYEILLVIVSFVIIAFLLPLTFNGAMSMGIFISLVTNIIALISLVINQLTFNIKALARNDEYLKDLESFYSLKEDDTITEWEEYRNLSIDKIEFKHVSFSYPGNENYSLKDISFILEKGRHYAFVGDNGAGKTTVVKLLTGLYHNYQGEILIGEKELRECSRSEIAGMFSVVYQDFAKYSISIFDNIAIGNVSKTSNKEIKYKVNQLEKQLKMDSFIDKLPRKDQTILGKLEEGDTQLSLGQWQKIALARALMKDALIYILDEPTSALDPISEKELYEDYKKLSKGKTTIFVSHRLGSIQLADEILVFRNGGLIEKGNYNTLMNDNTLFSEMYHKQRSKYT